MNKIILSALALTTTFAVGAKGLDLQSRVMLQRHAMEKAKVIKTPFKKDSKGYNTTVPTTDNGTVMGFVKIEDGYSREDIEAAGFNVLAVRGSVAIVGLPADSAHLFANRPGIRKLSLQRPVNPLLDKSRAASGVDAIHSGELLGIPYTGKGVLAGIVDQGVDPNHVSFLDANGKSRVTYLSHFDGSTDRYGVPYYYLYGDEIYGIDDNGQTFWYPTVDKFTTDEPTAYHGTHTMNILGGNYTGEIEIASGKNGNTPTIVNQKNPFYGVATDVKYAVSCGELQDACIAYGINGIIDYANYAREAEGIPSVLSLSLGSTAGAHDPKGLMNQFLDECGDETIVVVAAGNEGDLKIALSKNMTSEDNSMATMIYPYGYRFDPADGEASNKNTFIRSGAVFIYSNDKTPFTIKAFIMTGTEGNYRRRATLDISSETGDYYLSNSSYANYVGGAVNSTVARYFDGYLGGGSMYDEDLGRYYGVFDYYLYTNPENGINEDGSEGVIVGFEVTGVDGQRIECYCDGMNTWMSNYGIDGYMDGQRDGTISDMAVGHNVLVVGAYTTRDQWTSLNGEPYGYLESDGFIVGDIGQYSSFGTLADGRTLPHICAPGSAVISAVSTPYVETYYKGYEQYIPMDFQARTTIDGRTYYWKAETGTSMSTPFVAGSIALWLEADPTLNINDVRDIIAKTAIRDEFVERGNQVQWGAGKFDALGGLKEVIKRAGVQGVMVDSKNERLILTRDGERAYTIFVGDAASLDVAVYNLAGATVFADNFNGCEATIDLSGLTPGVYIVSVNNHTEKIIVK